jgi:hypothetical protein
MTVWEPDFFVCEARACGRHDPSFDARDEADQTAVCAIAGSDNDACCAALECGFPFIQPRDCSSAAGGPWHMWQRFADNNPASAAQHTRPHPERRSPLYSRPGAS